MINVIIDQLTPCLKDAHTGEVVPTEVIRVKRKSFLRKYNKRNGWYTKWDDLADENEIYALVIEGSMDIQGLVAVTPNDDMQALYISWMCVNPESNKQITRNIKYLGIGGHLFAIAAKKSIDYGYNGYMYGFAANQKLLKHYVQSFHGEIIAILHPYQFAIDEQAAKELMEVYDYEWTDETI